MKIVDMDIENCYIGDQILDSESGNIVCVKPEKGIKNINDYAKRRALSWKVLKQRFHERCRENHINEKTIPSLPTTDANKATTRLSSPAATVLVNLMFRNSIIVHAVYFAQRKYVNVVLNQLKYYRIRRKILIRCHL